MRLFKISHQEHVWIRLFFSAVVFVTLGISSSSAHAPAKIEFEYNAEAEQPVLIIKIDHVSRNRRAHYIRKMTLSINDGDPQVFRFATQISPKGLIREIPLKLEPGDVVRVDAVCSQAGVASQEFQSP